MKLQLALAAVLMIVAAAGLSSLESDEYCLPYGSEVTLTPPGWHCVPENLGPEHTAPPEPDTGGWAEFVGIAAIGLLFVFLVRSKVALGTAILLGIAGAAGLFAGFQAAVGAAMMLGLVVTLLATRSLTALAVAFAVTIAGFTLYLAGMGAEGWATAILLALVLWLAHAQKSVALPR